MTWVKTSMPVSVENIVFRNVADKSYMFQKSSVATPASVTYGDVVVNLEKPISGNTKAVAYLCEQVSDNLMAVLTIKMKNKTMVKEVKFPSILKRNTVYTVNISYSDNASLLVMPEKQGRCLVIITKSKYKCSSLRALQLGSHFHFYYGTYEPLRTFPWSETHFSSKRSFPNIREYHC